MNLINKYISNVKTDFIMVSATRVGNWWNAKNLNSPFSRLYLITDGRGWITHHNQRFELTKGILHVVPRFTFHNVECDGFMDHFYLHFVCEIANGIDIFRFNNYNFNIKAPGNCVDLFKRLIDINPNRGLPDYERKDLYDPIYECKDDADVNQLLANTIETSGIIRQLIVPILRTPQKCFTALEEFDDNFLKIVDYINENISRRITLEELAAISHLNPTYFSDKFTKIMGLRPTQYVIKRRVETAQLNLMTTEKNLSEIAYETGFSDLAHFNRAFKKMLGITPSKYRQALHHH
jgi:AraC-like DNA-binding protein